ncbi:MAG: hypothetical protein H0X40_16085 [Chthoniobacterales bacterium]|nr:hypothetical protein [Chthoniobacterales bacterium]
MIPARTWVSVLFLVVIGIALFALVLVSEENWRAARTLARCESSLRAAGENLDFECFIPPQVPDAENFAAAPVMSELVRVAQDEKVASPVRTERLRKILGKEKKAVPSANSGDFLLGKRIDLEGWRRALCAGASSPNEKLTDVATAEKILECMQTLAPEMAEVTKAAERPFARFPIDYARGPMMDLRHGTVLLHLSSLFSVRALAELYAARPGEGFRDLQTLLRLQHALQPEALVISHLVRLVILARTEQVIWEGLLQRSWNDAQLEDMQRSLSAIDLLSDYQNVIRGERAFSRITYQLVRDSRRRDKGKIEALHFFPAFPTALRSLSRLSASRAFVDQNEATQEQWMQDFILAAIEPKIHRVLRAKSERLNEEIKRSSWGPYAVFAKITLPIFSLATSGTAAAAAALDEASTAIALERFRLTNGHLPNDLAELVPNYLPRVPTDVMTGETLHFKKDGVADYRLYSLGWNLRDDNGAVVLENSHRREDEKGDWVWPSRAAAASGTLAADSASR